jgi:hypothetical protein
MQLLSLFGIPNTVFTDKHTAALVFALLGIIIFVSIQKGANMAGTGGDFAVFWWAGKNFLAGNDLYSNIGGAERYIYPPFAAMWFQLFGINSLQGAGTCWAFANFGFYAMSIVALRKIYLHFYPDTNTLKWAILAAAILSFRYFWYHQIYIQVNEIMFLLCLFGVLSHLQGKETAAATFFTVGAFVKVLPVFFLVWLVSKGSWRTVVKIGAVAAVCVALPMLFRGIEQGWLDHLRYYATFLEPFRQGRVEPEFRNYSLSSMVYNWCQPTQNEPMGFSYRLFGISLAQTKMVYKTAALTLVAVWFAMLVWSRFIVKKINFWEISYMLILMNLLSGICWEYHLLPIIFVFTPIIYTILQKNTPITLVHRAFILFLLGVCAFLNIVGTDTVGVKGMHYIGGYGVLTLVWLALAGYCVWRFFRKD